MDVLRGYSFINNLWDGFTPIVLPAVVQHPWNALVFWGDNRFDYLSLLEEITAAGNYMIQMTKCAHKRGKTIIPYFKLIYFDIAAML